MKKQKKYLGISIIAFLFIFSSLMTIFDIFRKLNKLTLINIISSSSSLYLFVAYLICGLGLIKRKLWAKQKEGKKRMKQFGKVEIPQKAFFAVLKV